VVKMLEIDSPPPPPPDAPCVPPDGVEAPAMSRVLLETGDEVPPPFNCWARAAPAKPPALDATSDSSEIISETWLAPPCVLSSDAKVLLASCDDALLLETGVAAVEVPWALPAASPSKSCRRLDTSCPAPDVAPAAPDAVVAGVFVPFCAKSD
jgi:hypothetical protein